MYTFDKILQKEMTRKQFILSLFSVLGAIVGIPTILGILTKGTSSSHSDDNLPGYGRQSYGP
jgi:hypothetical protein